MILNMRLLTADPNEKHKSSMHLCAAFRHFPLIRLARLTTNAGSKEIGGSCSFTHNLTQANC